MRERDARDLLGLYAQFCHLRSERLLHNCRRPRTDHSPWQHGNEVRVAGIPQHQIVAMHDQITVVTEYGRFANVHPWRPRRYVGDLRLAAVENVHALNAVSARDRRLRAACSQRENKYKKTCTESGEYTGVRHGNLLQSAARAPVHHRWTVILAQRGYAR